MTDDEENGHRFIKWNRRARWYIATQKWLRTVRASVLGVGLAWEAEGWDQRLTLNGVDDSGQPNVTRLSGCPICAALVPNENRPYHERWHLTGSIGPKIVVGEGL